MADSARILVVDDHPADLERTVRALQQAGLLATDIQVAHDAKEALDFFFRPNSQTSVRLPDPPEVVLLDIKLSKPGGPGLLWALKANERTRSIPVIAMISSGEVAEFLHRSGLSADGYINKPVTPGLLAEQINLRGKLTVGHAFPCKNSEKAVSGFTLQSA
jgi:CheY-like chemotaxis protein